MAESLQSGQHAAIIRGPDAGTDVTLVRPSGAREIFWIVRDPHGRELVVDATFLRVTG